MANSVLLRDITKYNMYSFAGDLPYTSDRSIANYKTMRLHPMCSLGLSFTTLGLPDVPFNVNCDDEKIKAIATKMLSQIWKRLLRDGFECLTYGFKALEKRYALGGFKYKINDDDKNEQEWSGVILKQPRSLDPEYIRIKVEEDGSLRGFCQDYSVGEVTVKDKKCLIFINDFESGNYYGISALERVYATWYKSNIIHQFYARWLERKGTGLFVGRYPAGSQPDGKDNSAVMLDLLGSIMEGTTIALPSGYDDKGNPMWDIMILDSQDKTDSFIQALEYHDKMILRGLVIPERALTQGEIGARSSVEAFTDIFIQRKQDILDNIVDYINKYLVKDFIDINFKDPPEVEVTAGQLGDAAKENALKIIEKLVDQRAVDIERKWLIDKTGIPILEKEMIDPEDLIPGEKQPQEEVEEVDDKKPEIEKPEEKSEETKKEELSEHEHKLADNNRWQNMTARERKFDLAAMDAYLSTRSVAFQDALREELIFQRDKIKAYLQKNIAGAKPWDVVRDIELKATPIRALYSSYMNDVYKYAYDQWRQSTENRIMFSEESAFIGFKTSLSANKFMNDILTALKQTISDGISRGLGTAEIIQNYQNTFDSFLESRIQTISETELSNILSKSNELYIMNNHRMIKNGALEPRKKVQRVQASAIMDKATCPLCEKLNGTIVDVDSPIRLKYSFPLHYLDRCVWIPITQEEIDDPRVVDTDLSVDGSTGKPFTSDGMTANLGNLINYRTFK